MLLPSNPMVTTPSNHTVTYTNKRYTNKGNKEEEEEIILGGSIIIEDPISLSSSYHQKSFLSHLKSITNVLIGLYYLSSLQSKYKRLQWVLDLVCLPCLFEKYISLDN